MTALHDDTPDLPYDDEPEPYPCEFCGHRLDDEEDAFDHSMGECAFQTMLWMKGLVGPEDTLTSLAERFEALAADLHSKAKDGWEVVQPPDNGHVFMGKRGAGAWTKV